jgi:hypothetical protein
MDAWISVRTQVSEEADGRSPMGGWVVMDPRGSHVRYGVRLHTCHARDLTSMPSMDGPQAGADHSLMRGTVDARPIPAPGGPTGLKPAPRPILLHSPHEIFVRSMRSMRSMERRRAPNGAPRPILPHTHHQILVVSMMSMVSMQRGGAPNRAPRPMLHTKSSCAACAACAAWDRTYPSGIGRRPEVPSFPALRGR